MFLSSKILKIKLWAGLILFLLVALSTPLASAQNFHKNPTLSNSLNAKSKKSVIPKKSVSKKTNNPSTPAPKVKKETVLLPAVEATSPSLANIDASKTLPKKAQEAAPLKIQVEVNNDQRIIKDLEKLSAENPDQLVFAIDPESLKVIEEGDKNNQDLETPPDPMEKWNRTIWAFNNVFYQVVVGPLRKIYVFVVPTVIRSGVTRFAYNLATPVRMTNLLLQKKGSKSGQEFFRFLINTTIGIGGIFDPATSLFKIPKSEASFSQTLGRWGMGPITYIVLPIMGPYLIPEAIGAIVDKLIDPATWIPIVSIVVSVDGVFYKLEELETLEDMGFDTYRLVQKIKYWMWKASVYKSKQEKQPEQK